MFSQKKERGYVVPTTDSDVDGSDINDAIGYSMKKKKDNTMSTKIIRYIIGIACFTMIIFAFGMIFGMAAEYFIIETTQSVNNNNNINNNKNNIDKTNGIFVNDNLLNKISHNSYGARKPGNIDIDEDEQRMLEKNEKCSRLNCCRQQDTVETDGENECQDMSWLECISDNNGCVWDCAAKQNDNDVEFDEEFLGIDPHDAAGDDLYFIDDEEEQKNARIIDDNGDFGDMMDECGSRYALKPKGGNNILIQYNGTEQHQDEQNDTDNEIMRRLYANDDEFRRNLVVLGRDTRVPITRLINPYCRTCYITFSTSTGTKRCTGTLISKRHVLTAGHCISNGAGKFYWNFKIYPSLNAGSRKSFSYSQVWVFNNWHRRRSRDWDMGIITLKTSNTRFGYLGFGWNNGINSRWSFRSTSYPADKGRIMQYVLYPMNHAIWTHLMASKTSDTTGGSSGGGIYTYRNIIYCVHAYGVRGSHNGCTRITKSKYTAICNYLKRFPESRTRCG